MKKAAQKTLVAMTSCIIVIILIIGLFRSKDEPTISGISQAKDGHYYITNNEGTYHAPECDHKSHKNSNK